MRLEQLLSVKSFVGHFFFECVLLVLIIHPDESVAFWGLFLLNNFDVLSTSAAHVGLLHLIREFPNLVREGGLKDLRDWVLVRVITTK